MDLTKMKNDKKLELCRWYFRAGFFCLPLVWLVNAVWFFGEAFRKPPYEEQKSIKTLVANVYIFCTVVCRSDVILSGIGATIWAVVIAVWIYIFQTHRAEWGEFGDDLSFIIPTGIK